eukprot:CAMPEP_0118965396 /NCGR_PEP_ID=MMETSP1173-20130426/2975_1 /TAXON_ID=1034831 /ORGANISM="Rhizochromulina marina cf, Strain CCMP1243" /LENGTH=77 /DNA_ID=CAMNT_0006914009 /DNA_START=13 /DNA_END=246 /DNA_ORIENTATION=-
MASAENVVLNVEMTCGGCSGAVTRILSKLPGVAEVNASLEEQKVYITVGEDAPPPEEMLAALEKWSKASNKAISLAE